MPNDQFDRDADAAIDRAIREIMGVEPRADMRARVLAKLNAPSPRRLMMPRLAIASAVAAALIAGFFIANRTPAPAPPVEVARNPPAARPAPVIPPERPPVVPPLPETTLAANDPAPAAVEEIPRGHVVAQSLVETPAASNELTPLVELAPLAIEDISKQGPTVTDIVVGALVMKDLQVDPLAVGGR